MTVRHRKLIYIVWREGALSMKVSHRRTAELIIALSGLFAFLTAPLLSYQHLSVHIHIYLTQRGLELPCPSSSPGTLCSDTNAQISQNDGKGGPNPLCDDSGCPFIHFLRTNSSPPASSYAIFASDDTLGLGLATFFPRPERNPGQVPLLALSPAISPPFSAIS